LYEVSGSDVTIISVVDQLVFQVLQVLVLGCHLREKGVTLI
jgi:hypothetical protein